MKKNSESVSDHQVKAKHVSDMGMTDPQQTLARGNGASTVKRPANKQEPTGRSSPRRRTRSRTRSDDEQIESEIEDGEDDLHQQQDQHQLAQHDINISSHQHFRPASTSSLDEGTSSFSHTSTDEGGDGDELSSGQHRTSSSSSSAYAAPLEPLNEETADDETDGYDDDVDDDEEDLEEEQQGEHHHPSASFNTSSNIQHHPAPTRPANVTSIQWATSKPGSDHATASLPPIVVPSTSSTVQPSIAHYSSVIQKPLSSSTSSSMVRPHHHLHQQQQQHPTVIAYESGASGNPPPISSAAITPTSSPLGSGNLATAMATSATSRRQAHIASEQKRRQSINEGFEDLRRCVPNCTNAGDSKAVILRKAVNYLRQLHNENARLKAHLAGHPMPPLPATAAGGASSSGTASLSGPMRHEWSSSAQSISSIAAAQPQPLAPTGYYKPYTAAPPPIVSAQSADTTQPTKVEDGVSCATSKPASALTARAPPSATTTQQQQQQQQPSAYGYGSTYGGAPQQPFYQTSYQMSHQPSHVMGQMASPQYQHYQQQQQPYMMHAQQHAGPNYHHPSSSGPGGMSGTVGYYNNMPPPPPPHHLGGSSGSYGYGTHHPQMMGHPSQHQQHAPPSTIAYAYQQQHPGAQQRPSSSIDVNRDDYELSAASLSMLRREASSGAASPIAADQNQSSAGAASKGSSESEKSS